MRRIYLFLSNREKKIFDKYKSKKRFNIFDYLTLLIRGFFSLIESLLRIISGPIGLRLREVYYTSLFIKSGKNILIDTGVIIDSPQNIEIGSNVWISSYCTIAPNLGHLKIGSNIHINSHTHIAGRGKIVLEDNVNISAGAKIFSGAVIIPSRDKLVWNPMMKEDLSLSNIGPIVMKNNSTVFANCTVAPGVTLGEGSVLLSNSFLNKNIKDYEIFCGVPAIKIGKRTN